MRQDPLPNCTSFPERVFWLVHQIPSGSVATYGQIAYLAGSARAARAVGNLMRRCHEHGQHNLPWHRVITAQGTASLRGKDPTHQSNLLKAEGIIMNDALRCDLDTYEWTPEFTCWERGW